MSEVRTMISGLQLKLNSTTSSHIYTVLIEFGPFDGFYVSVITEYEEALALDLESMKMLRDALTKMIDIKEGEQK
ncbi:hypothetical protein C1Y63_04875 [Corynebacterium sp. 13CS0277]|uniref:hypothetical protein n=1 Tax=Corynebacterium sp. 13CS0277 TaxID=2071994 RepID=UPI000D0325E8|nr:hypothetical protein [Corynebacterium sp. 13CS0277]PRQ11745.1 hypothetical protein C1Y63_04875 [Corynebacterium sp. 13CS0277]